VLCCVVLCCAVLCCVVLCCVVLRVRGFGWVMFGLCGGVTADRAQNYPDVVNEPAEEVSPWFAVYFMLFSFVGMFLLMSLLVAYFQKYYVAEYDKKEDVTRALVTVRRRAGLLLAFLLLKDMEAKDMSSTARGQRVARAQEHRYNPRLERASRQAHLRSRPTRISRGTFDLFFVSCGVSVPSSTELRRRNRDRFEAFKYDTECVLLLVCVCVCVCVCCGCVWWWWWW